MIDPQQFPRYSGITTFMRTPYVPEADDLGDADLAFVGAPWDADNTYRVGARFGPRAIREASTLLKPYNPVQGTDLGDHTVVDHGDSMTLPGYTLDSIDLMEETFSEVIATGTVPAVAGGNDMVPLPALRALADEHGPLSMVHFDAHSDLWPEYFGKQYNHGTWAHYAIEEGLLDPETSIRVGDRGPLYDAGDPERFDDAGIEYYTTEEFDEMGVAETMDRVHDRVEGPVYVNLDIDCVDPAFAPGTGAPEPGGFTSREIRSMVRRLMGLDLAGFAVVEVAPPYDDQSNTTAILAANLMWELTHVALA